MTIGRSSRKNKAPRSPPFLDKANGFYGRLDEIFGDDVQMERETTDEQIGTLNRSTQDNSTAPGWIEEDDHAGDFNQGMMEDDGTTLLKRKPSRLSRRWSRMSSRKGKYDKFSSEKELGSETSKPTSVDLNPEVPPATQTLGNSKEPEPTLVHFSVREHADDQILISGKNEGEREMEDSRKEKKTEGTLNEESMEVVKRNTLKNYRKAVDRAFRRGWETFVANLYSVTLTPISSTSSSSTPSDKTELNRNRVLAEFR
ncbi:uncharacterized protein sb:cb1058 [Puntigrus tetrazona]|uniref:uncharacterized protein sb:cb1058 n=1 Tax=Puntigrus tetrazona TaxID=1606681 RepID=UPI001C896260|nr:uncharacterized protein sb:cb1058 [Puntigrus tetrazona]XP_043099374.1 uncharacterized protein sb:cb1058 [Puntigrus tetrazona]XP_043099375.1 uncharacterized protein sb:cb1058 [Puntigrus tetrazona]XP_043099376.1 uncharacterized protein sb:cb1058 [Puntigrus tetrazona]